MSTGLVSTLIMKQCDQLSSFLIVVILMFKVTMWFK